MTGKRLLRVYCQMCFTFVSSSMSGQIGSCQKVYGDFAEYF